MFDRLSERILIFWFKKKKSPCTWKVLSSFMTFFRTLADVNTSYVISFDTEFQTWSNLNLTGCRYTECLRSQKVDIGFGCRLACLSKFDRISDSFIIAYAELGPITTLSGRVCCSFWEICVSMNDHDKYVSNGIRRTFAVIKKNKMFSKSFTFPRCLFRPMSIMHV